MNTTRLGAALRAVRIRLGLRQADVAHRAGVSRQTVSRAERGLAGSLPLDTLERVAASVEIQIDLVARWRGGDLPRTLNASPAALHEAIARLLASVPGWSFAPEVSFSVYGERGTIDVLAYHSLDRCLLVIELKTELVDVQGLLGSVDRYRRLAPGLARQRGWDPVRTSVWVVLRETDVNRRRVAAHAAVLRAGLPVDGWGMRRWLREPRGVVAGLSFLSDAHIRSISGAIGGIRRVRRRERA